MILERRDGALAIPLWLVWLAAAGFVLGGLGSFGVLDNNEGLYAEIPREMLAAHDWRAWIIPHLNGLPYMEKPPLLYWLTALSFSLLGESEWAVRLVPALSSLGCVALLLHFGTLLRRPQAGRLAALMFVSGIGVIAMSRVLMFDMLLGFLLTASLMFSYRYAEEGAARLLRWSYAFLALAVLAKGFVALVLFGLVVLGFSMSTSRHDGSLSRAIGKWFDPGAIAVFLLIAAPWHIAAALVEPVFSWFYFINEHVLRFLGQREPHDYYAGAWWYYLPRMAIYLFPWSFLVLCMLARPVQSMGRDAPRLKRFLLLAWIMPLLFFSVSSAKANYYLVAVMPFAAFHLAAGLEDRAFLSGWMRALPGLLVGALAIAAVFVLMRRGDDPQQTLVVAGMSQARFQLWLAGGLSVVAFGAALLAWRKAAIGVLAYLGISAWIATALALILGAMEPLTSTRLLAQYLQSDLNGRPVYLFRNFEEMSSLPFYLKKPLPIIDARSNDLFWGNKLRPENGIFVSGAQFARELARQPLAVVVMERQLQDFRAAEYAGRFKGEKRIGQLTVFFN